MLGAFFYMRHRDAVVAACIFNAWLVSTGIMGLIFGLVNNVACVAAWVLVVVLFNLPKTQRID